MDETDSPAEPPVPSARELAIDALLAAWLNEHIANSPVSRSTEAWNHIVNTALPALRSRLLSEG